MLNTKTMLTNISKGQSSIPLRYLIQGLENEYDQMKNKIHIVFVNRSGSKNTVYFKTPSSSLNNLFYDCVFEFDCETPNKVTSNTPFKVYCNSPSFYFRYANIFKRYGSLLYPEKYPSFLDIPAEVRNSAQVTGFDKYVYSCLRIATSLSIDSMVERSESNGAPRIMTFNEKQTEYRRKKRGETTEES